VSLRVNRGDASVVAYQALPRKWALTPAQQNDGQWGPGQLGPDQRLCGAKPASLCGTPTSNFMDNDDYPWS
jgi:hypothetical protein